MTRANRCYELLHRRHPDADQVEVVEIATTEVVLFWDVLHAEARRFVTALREDLNRLEDDVFMERWGAVEGPQDLR
jgi:hypothetical protein